MKIIEQVPIFVFAEFILKQTHGGNDSQCHNDVIKTAELVGSCPVNQTENEIATLRKACHLISNECPTFEYHCAVSRFFNGTYEVCAPIKQIVLSRCTEFNKGGGVIQGSQHEKGFCRSCPVVYDSNKSYKFRECYDRVIRDVENISERKYQNFSTGLLHTETSTRSTSQDSTTEENVEKKDNYYIWIPIVLGIIIVAAVPVLALICYRHYKQKDAYMVIKGDITKSDDDGMRYSSLLKNRRRYADTVVFDSEEEKRNLSEEVADVFEEETRNSSDEDADVFEEESRNSSEEESDVFEEESRNLSEEESDVFKEEHPVATHRENKDLRIFKEEWVRRSKFERCRCVSENDKKYYSHIGYSSNVQPQDINLDEQRESIPLLERKNLRRKDYRTSLAGIVNQIHNAESDASEIISSGINVDKPVIREQQMCNNTFRSDIRRKDRKQSELPVELKNVRGRRRIRSESDAVNVSSEDISKFSKMLSSIPEIDNINKQNR